MAICSRAPPFAIFLFLSLLFPFPSHQSTHNYEDALSKSILFFEGQRSGKLPPNQRVKWRGDSGLSDGSDMKVDLVGGYYDAGDNVKFGFPMAFTTTMLSWSVLEFGGKMGKELGNAKEAIRWATDYLLKATKKKETIYVQVGNANEDHLCWERPEDMDTPRIVSKIDSSKPGSDVAAETAAALAAASMVFRKSDPNYSKILRNRAKEVFAFADKYRDSYSNGLKDEVCPFYCSYSGFQDELLWGSAWLLQATLENEFLEYINKNGQTLGADEADNTFGWDNKHIGARVLLSRGYLLQNIIQLKDYKIHADSYMCSLIPGNGAAGSRYTPSGLLYEMEDANMQYVTSTTLLLLVFAKYLAKSKQTVSCMTSKNIGPKHLRSIAKRQVNYILGDNPLNMSYMVGYGSKFPRRIHHRGASLPSIHNHPQKIDCLYGFSIPPDSPNNNTHIGAIVGGPDERDQFKDERCNYAQTEPTTYINAPLVGALAYLSHAFR